jgi:integrase
MVGSLDRALESLVTEADRPRLTPHGLRHTAATQTVRGARDVSELLAALEDARDSLSDAGHLTTVVSIEAQVRVLSRRLDFDDRWGGNDAH